MLKRKIEHRYEYPAKTLQTVYVEEINLQNEGQVARKQPLYPSTTTPL